MKISKGFITKLGAGRPRPPPKKKIQVLKQCSKKIKELTNRPNNYRDNVLFSQFHFYNFTCFSKILLRLWIIHNFKDFVGFIGGFLFILIDNSTIYITNENCKNSL